MGWRPALQRWTRCGQLQIISVLKAEHFQKFQVGVLMALAVAREGKQPTSLFGNLPGGSQLTLWYLDDLWIGLGWVGSLFGNLPHGSQLTLWYLDGFGLGWVFETSLAAPSSLSDIMLLNVDWIGLGPSLETSLVAPNSHSDIIYVAPWSYIWLDGCGWIGYWLPAHNCDQYLLNLFALASPFDSRETSWSILHVTHLI